MKSNKYFTISFVVLALVQLVVPVKMIIDQENILNAGTEFRFKAQLAYPESDLSGKFIRLSYDQDKYPVADDLEFQKGQIVFVIFKEGSSGFAIIDTILKSKPDYTSIFVEARIRYIQKEDEISQLILEYPFEKFFLEESRLSDEAMENLRARTASALSTHSVIRIHSGKAAIKDILIDDVSILRL